MRLAYEAGVSAVLTKYAISRGRAYTRQLTQRAATNPALAAGRDAAIQTFYPPRFLGEGQEGYAHRVMRPTASGQLDPRAKKIYDPTRAADAPEMFARRLRLAPELEASGLFPKVHGAGMDAATGLPYIESEFVPGRSPAASEATRAFGQRAELAAIKAGRKAGMNLRPTDIRAANMIVDPRTGKPKVVDFIPTTRSEAMDPKTKASLGLTGAGWAPTTEGALMLSNRDPAEAHRYDQIAAEHSLLRGATQRMHPKMRPDAPLPVAAPAGSRLSAGDKTLPGPSPVQRRLREALADRTQLDRPPPPVNFEAQTLNDPTRLIP